MLNHNLINIITNYVGFYKGINFNIPFFEENIDKVDWSSLSGNTDIPFTFFEKHISSCERLGVPDKLDWYSLSRNINIPYQFFEKYLDKVNWSCLSKNTNIPVTFFEKYISSCEQLGVPDKVDWSYLSYNTNIPVEFFSLPVEKTVRNIWIYKVKR